MTSTTDPLVLDGADDPAAVLAYARAQKKVEDDAAREVMKAAARWAAMHSTDTLVGPVDDWHETGFPMGGEGCPEVAEFAVVEFAAALGKSTDAGRRYLTKAVEGSYRLRGCWARLEAGALPAWKLGFIADQTLGLSPAAAVYVDQHVAGVAHKIGPAQLARVIEEAKARFDPEQTEKERLTAAEHRHFDLIIDQVSTAGTVHLDADLDLADALDLEAAVAADAHQQLLLGSTESLDVRRSIAAGNLARHQHVLDLDTPDAAGVRQPAPRKREIVLHVHLEHAAVLGAGGLARLHETPGPVTAEQVRTWCANPDTHVTVQPVLDLAEHLHVNSYQATARLKLQTQLRDNTCVFAYCYRPAEQCDCEHRVAYDPDHPDDGGPTCSCNQAPCCRRHHRAKTTGGWTYITVEPGVYLWRSPLGYQFLKDASGTLDVTPDEERRTLAREFRAHLGPTAGAADPEP